MEFRELDTICQELARRELYEKIRYFVPNGGQLRFIFELTREPYPLVAINASGNGGGKTYLIAALLGAIMWPKMSPPCFQDKLFQKWPFPKRLRIASTPKEIEEIGALQTAIKHLWPKNKYDAQKKGKSYPSQFKSDTGFILDLMTYEQADSEFAGPSLGLVVFNEPPPEGIYKECIMRLRKGGIAIGAMTSLRENPWVVSGIFDKANGKDIRVLYSDVEENCIEHGTNGTLEHVQVEKILTQYPPEEREARKTGKPLGFFGRIYKCFNRDVHVSKNEFYPNTNEKISIGMVVDPAIAKPLAIVWRYVDLAGVVNYFDEYPEIEFHGAADTNLTVKDYVELIAAKEKGLIVGTRILDRHFGNVRRTLGGRTLKEEFAEAGLWFQDSYALDAQAEVETGVMKVNSYLRYDKSKPIDSLNCPKIRISPKCENLIAAFEKWGRNPDTGKPQEDFKDFMDLVRYDLMTDPAVDGPRPSWEGVKPHYGVGNT